MIRVFTFYVLLLIACNNSPTHQIVSSPIPDSTTIRPISSLVQLNRMMMLNAALEGNADKDFATLLRLHRLGSVETGRRLIKDGKSSELKEMVRTIISEQEREIGLFNSFLSSPQKQNNTDPFNTEALTIIKKVQLNNQPIGTVDQQYVNAIIPYYTIAIDLADSYLDKGGKDDKLRMMAGKIIEDQRRQIINLQDWLLTTR